MDERKRDKWVEQAEGNTGRVWAGGGEVGGEAEGPHPRRREENEDTFAHGLGFAVAVVLSSLFPSVFLSLRFCFAIKCLNCEN